MALTQAASHIARDFNKFSLIGWSGRSENTRYRGLPDSYRQMSQGTKSDTVRVADSAVVRSGLVRKLNIGAGMRRKVVQTGPAFAFTA
jgi:hypothetical protein